MLERPFVQHNKSLTTANATRYMVHHRDREKSVALLLRVKHVGKWKRLATAYGRNGRFRPGYAQLGEGQVKFGKPGERRLYKGRQAKYIPGGRNASDTEAEWARQAANL